MSISSITPVRRRATAVLLALTLPLGLAACGGDDGGGSDPAPGDTGSGDAGGSSGSGPFTGELETGVAISAELWVPASDPELTDVEAWRERTGAAPVLYGRITLTNDTDAADTGRFLTLTGPDGQPFAEESVEVSFLCSQIHRWWDDSADRDELVEEYFEILTERCDGNFLGGPTVEPGASLVYWVAVPGAEPTFSRVFAGLGNELTR